MRTFLDDCFRYVSMSSADFERLAALLPVVEPHFPAIARTFYAAVLADPATARLIEGPAQIERLHAALVDWMRTGLRGPYDTAFYERRARIGRRHVQIGLAQHHMFMAMCGIRIAYQEIVLAAYPASDLPAVLASVHKLLDVELAIMVRHYQLDSETKLLERERRAQAERVTAMQTLTAGLAHEVRNPLNAAKLQLELLDRRLRRTQDDARLTEPSALANKEIDRLTHLLDDFLAFARPPELHLEERDVLELVHHVCDLERPAAALRHAEIEIATQAQPLVARFDVAKTHQVIANLLTNAIQAVPDGGRIRVTLTATAENFTIGVEDNGSGIPIDLQGRIYEPFFSTKEAGTGLGMSIVYSLVTLHGGTITLESGEQGTRFEVTIPRRK